MSDGDRIAAAFGAIFEGDGTHVDLEVIDRVIAAAAPLTSDETTILMTGGDQFQTTYEGSYGSLTPRIELEQPSAAVWKFGDERVAQVEFHLSHEGAGESARIPA